MGIWRYRLWKPPNIRFSWKWIQKYWRLRGTGWSLRRTRTSSLLFYATEKGTHWCLRWRMGLRTKSWGHGRHRVFRSSDCGESDLTKSIHFLFSQIFNLLHWYKHTKLYHNQSYYFHNLFNKDYIYLYLILTKSLDNNLFSSFFRMREGKVNLVIQRESLWASYSNVDFLQLLQYKLHGNSLFAYLHIHVFLVVLCLLKFQHLNVLHVTEFQHNSTVILWHTYLKSPILHSH